MTIVIFKDQVKNHFSSMQLWSKFKESMSVTRGIYKLTLPLSDLSPQEQSAHC